MANPGFPPGSIDEAKRLVEEHGSVAAASRASGIPDATLRHRYRAAQVDPEILEAAAAGGISDPSNINHFWKIVKGEDGNGYSIHVNNSDKGIAFGDMVRESIAEALADGPPAYPAREHTTGEYLLVVDLADVHFLKLCVASETGYTYNREVARHRVIEGTKALLRLSVAFPVQRILFVLGNDILHVDGPRPMTTSGTPQDTDGTIFQGFKDAFSALKSAIELCAEVAPVDLIHCMSNHDWTHGWALSQTLAAIFEAHPDVNSTAYNMSEAHRKYYRFAGNLFGLTHGDGAKEEKLYGMMVKEGRQHVGECRNLYWLLHHTHHKTRKRRGVDVFESEKDHNGMTAISTGSHAPDGAHINIEYIRSPSPPDGWHDRNAFVNRQAVECFLFHPNDGQKIRLTEWF